ncbi:MAG: biotin/lipoyl-containing protein, partial [Methylotenera sp.]
MSEKLFKTLGSANEFVKKQPWITRPFYYFLDKFTPTQTRDNLSWVDEADLVMIEQTPVRAKFLLYAIAFVLLAFLVWAYFSEVQEVSRGEGRVIPSKQVQVIQSLDGGIVSEILVTEGQSVEVGTPLVRIDETRAISSLRENQSQFYALLAKQARLKALADDTPFSPPPEVKKEAPEIYDQEYAFYLNSREELRSAVGIANDQMVQREKELLELQYKKESAERVYESTSKELTANKPLLASGAVSEIDILRLEREASRARGEID